MGIIYGKIKNKYGEPIDNAIVGIKNKDFEDLHTTYTDENGNYQFEIENKNYPYLYAVKDYAVNNLEFWCQDIDLSDDNDIEINVMIDKLEIYGLKVFKIDGAYPALMIYFRPMSLDKHLQGISDIFPSIERFEIKINDIISDIYITNTVEEFIGNGETLKSYLLHVSLPEEGLKEVANYLSVQIVDTDGNLGQAATYFEFNK